MKDLLLIGLPRAFGAMTLVSVLLGALNRILGWSLALRIGGSTIAPLEDVAGLVVMGLVGLLALAFAEAVDRDLLGALRRRGPRAWALAVAATVAVPLVVCSQAERLWYGSRAAWAAGTGQVAVVREELASAADPKALAEQLLREVSLSDQAAVAAVLLDAGARPDLKEPEGLPLLGRAVLQGAVGVTAALLEHGADPDLPDAHGATPLILAAGYGNADEDTRLRLVELLLARGADPSKRNRFDVDAVLQARRSGNARVATRLEAVRP